jgi:hypothetical protein
LQETVASSFMSSLRCSSSSSPSSSAFLSACSHLLLNDLNCVVLEVVEDLALSDAVVLNLRLVDSFLEITKEAEDLSSILQEPLASVGNFGLRDEGDGCCRIGIDQSRSIGLALICDGNSVRDGPNLLASMVG